MLRTIPTLLVLVHCALFAWAAVGIAELLLPDVPWPKVGNAAFPGWLLLLHWLAVLAGSGAFVVGYATCWCRTPVAMVAAYGAMAAVCIIETFWFLSGPFRFVAMLMELVAYVSIVAMLRYLTPFKQRFAEGHTANPALGAP